MDTDPDETFTKELAILLSIYYNKLHKWPQLGNNKHFRSIMTQTYTLVSMNQSSYIHNLYTSLKTGEPFNKLRFIKSNINVGQQWHHLKEYHILHLSVFYHTNTRGDKWPAILGQCDSHHNWHFYLAISSGGIALIFYTHTYTLYAVLPDIIPATHINLLLWELWWVYQVNITNGVKNIE